MNVSKVISIILIHEYIFAQNWWLHNKFLIIERTYRKAPQKPPSSVHVYGINPSTVRVVWRYVSPAQDEEPIEGYKVAVMILRKIIFYSK